jgi:type I restriction enzyme S subunit
MINQTLPIGWEWKTLGDCVDILDSQRVPVNREDRVKRNVNKDKSNLYPYYGATGLVDWIDDYIFDEEILLLGEDGAPFLESNKDKAYIVRGKCWVNNHAHVLKAKREITTNLFLMHYLNIFDYHEYVTGTTRYKLNQARMREFPIPIPPLPEQERIVERIESLFTQLDAGVSGLRRLKEVLYKYKESVLNITFNKHKEWKWSRFGDVTTVLRGASPRPKGNPKYFGGTIPWIKISDVTSESGKYLTQTVDTVTVEGSRKSKYLSKGTLILSICATVCVPKILDIDGCVHDGFVYFPSLPKDIDTSFLYYYLYSIRLKVIQDNRQGMTQVNLNTDIVRNFQIPYPSLIEQKRIVVDVEQKLSLVQELEQIINANLKRSDRLRQAILKRSFEGKLL